MAEKESRPFREEPEILTFILPELLAYARSLLTNFQLVKVRLYSEKQKRACSH